MLFHMEGRLSSLVLFSTLKAGNSLSSKLSSHIFFMYNFAMEEYCLFFLLQNFSHCYLFALWLSDSLALVNCLMAARFLAKGYCLQEVTNLF